MDEESEKPCIQDRLRSAAMRLKEIFASWPIISLIVIISIFIVARPEILTNLIGREVLIPIFSEVSLESRFDIIFSIAMILLVSLQYKINKSLLRIEEQRIQPFLYAEIDVDEHGFLRKILIRNRGGGIAYFSKITA